MDQRDIETTLNFLALYKLIKKEKGQWRPFSKRIHVNNEDIRSKFHHRNYHLKTLEQLDKFNKRNLHFSSLIAVSKDDAKKIQDLILRLIQDSEKIIGPSCEEVPRVFSLSYYEPI